MLENLETVEWAHIAQPEWNSPNEVPDALRSVLKVNTEANANRAYHRLLYALGNNHAGTYYPVAISVAPFLGELLHHENALVREMVLDVLIDLVCSFEGEQGFKTVSSADGTQEPIELVLRRAVAELMPSIKQCASNAENTSREHKLAVDLLNELETQDSRW